jgi:hypothetical protein
MEKSQRPAEVGCAGTEDCGGENLVIGYLLSVISYQGGSPWLDVGLGTLSHLTYAFIVIYLITVINVWKNHGNQINHFKIIVKTGRMPLAKGYHPDN